MEQRPKVSSLINSLANYKTLPEHTEEPDENRKTAIKVHITLLIVFALVIVSVTARYSEGLLFWRFEYSEGSLFRRSVIPKVR